MRVRCRLDGPCRGSVRAALWTRLRRRSNDGRRRGTGSADPDGDGRHRCESTRRCCGGADQRPRHRAAVITSWFRPRWVPRPAARRGSPASRGEEEARADGHTEHDRHEADAVATGRPPEHIRRIGRRKRASSRRRLHATRLGRRRVRCPGAIGRRRGRGRRGRALGRADLAALHLERDVASDDVHRRVAVSAIVGDEDVGAKGVATGLESGTALEPVGELAITVDPGELAVRRVDDLLAIDHDVGLVGPGLATLLVTLDDTSAYSDSASQSYWRYSLARTGRPSTPASVISEKNVDPRDESSVEPSTVAEPVGGCRSGCVGGRHERGQEKQGTDRDRGR